jgi:hypothetical protein
MEFLSLFFHAILLRIASDTSYVSSGEIELFKGHRLYLMIMVVFNFKVFILGHGKCFEGMNGLSILRFFMIN